MSILDENEVGRGHVSNAVFEKIEKISVWTKFLANLGFCVLIGLCILLLDTILTDVFQYNRGVVMIIFECVLLGFLILLVVPCVFLLKFSNKSNTSSFQKSPDNIIIALQYLNRSVKWLSGLIIAFLIIVFFNFIYLVFTNY